MFLLPLVFTSLKIYEPKLSHTLRYIVRQLIAAVVHWPLAKVALVSEKIGVSANNHPLIFYRNLSFYVMRTDALDRFGASLKRRFTKVPVEEMLVNAGFADAQFSEKELFWCIFAIKAEG